MSPFDLRLIELLHGHRTPIHSQVIADLLGGASPRTVRTYLRGLELAGRVSRPYGVRSGWTIAVQTKRA